METTSWVLVEDTVVADKVHAIVEARKMAEIGCPSYGKLWAICNDNKIVLEDDEPGKYLWGDRHHTLLDHRVETRKVDDEVSYRHSPLRWSRDANVVIVPGAVYDAVESQIDLSRQSFTQQYVLCNKAFKDWFVRDLEALMSTFVEEKDAFQLRFSTVTQMAVPADISSEALVHYVKTDWAPHRSVVSAIYEPETNCVIIELEYARDLSPIAWPAPEWVERQLAKAA